MLVASTVGNGFIVPQADITANTRKGKQVMHAGFPELYGSRWLLVLSHILVALIYGIFRVGLFLSRRETAQPE